jgi:hypothetical protein
MIYQRHVGVLSVFPADGVWFSLQNRKVFTRARYGDFHSLRPILPVSYMNPVHTVHTHRCLHGTSSLFLSDFRQANWVMWYASDLHIDYPRLRILWFSSVLPGKCWYSTLKEAMAFPTSFPVDHSLSAYLWMLSSLRGWQHLQVSGLIIPYSTQIYCFFGLCPSSGVLETRKHNVTIFRTLQNLIPYRFLILRCKAWAVDRVVK